MGRINKPIQLNAAPALPNAAVEETAASIIDQMELRLWIRVMGGGGRGKGDELEER